MDEVIPEQAVRRSPRPIQAPRVSAEGRVIGLNTSQLPVRTANVKDYGAKGDGVSIDTAAIQAACDAVDTSGAVYFPRGEYIARNIRPNSMTRMFGDEATLIYEANDGEFDAIISLGDQKTVGGVTTDSNVHSIHISGLTFRGNGDTLGLNENQALIHLSGVSDVTIVGCSFLGMQGDGIYVGMTAFAAQERHNERISVIGNVFDGLGNHGRQGVSIIEGRDVLIAENSFSRLAASTMPGAVDIEPNPYDVTAVLRDITVRGNTFTEIGGNVGDVALYLPNIIFNDGPPRGFTFEDNHHSGGGRPYYIHWDSHDPAVDDLNMEIVIRRNTAETKREGEGGDVAVLIMGVRGVVVAENSFSGFARGLAIVRNTADCEFSKNTVLECGELTWSLLDCAGEVTNVVVSRNHIEKREGHVIDQLLVAGPGLSSGVRMVDNVTLRVSTLMATYGGHRTLTGQNYARGNVGAAVDPALFAKPTGDGG
ncbi:glycosyl hydrolase family 28-related protein [Mycetocola zhujimingii]|nr:glycosyl hydrolase family 28-related protein [Mycetocola zhujimingii]